MKLLPENHFWLWFQKNQTTYLHLQEQQENEFDYWQKELADHLNTYSNGTLAALRCNTTAGQGSLIFRQPKQSFHGGKLEALVKAAPAMPDWQVILTSDMVIPRYPDADTLYCALIEDMDEEGRPGLLVYVPIEGNVPETLKETIESMVNKQLSDAACLTKLAAIAVEDMSELPMYNNLPTLAQLPAYLQQKKQAS